MLEHVVVYHDPEGFCAWPANHGCWIWGDEIVVGFACGKYRRGSGHCIAPPYRVDHARSFDGGETWQHESPAWPYEENDVFQEGRGEERLMPSNMPGPFDVRIAGNFEFGILAPAPCFYVSLDRWKSWLGPYSLEGAKDAYTDHNTSRTNYLVDDEGILAFMSGDPAGIGAYEDRAFCARLRPGAQQWEFVSWIISPKDEYRAVCPSGVRVSSSHLVVAIRRKAGGSTWLDAYESHDNGKNWTFLSEIADTKRRNGNPPALCRLQDGRLCCAYGLRTEQKMCVKFSVDNGATWGNEVVLRLCEDKDFGYPQLVQRPDGKLVCIYYWADSERPEQHIAATIWNP